MLKRNSFVALALAAGALTAASVAFTQEHAMPTPTEQHKHVLQGVGTWAGTITAFIPGMPEEPIEASESVTGIGPFWTQSTFESTFMGAPYTGAGAFGYDLNKQKFVGTWIDSMSTHISVMEGEVDESTGKIVMHWEAPGMTGEMEKHRSETVRTDDAYTMTFFMGEGEAAMKSMVIDMKRTGAKPVEAGAGR